jgi:hypothetical protein
VLWCYTASIYTANEYIISHSPLSHETLTEMQKALEREHEERH